MSGKRLGNYRAGDRSEYLALFGLSRFSFVYPFPRQEDFGVVDFLCILAKKEGKFIYPENAFYVQAKSNETLDPLDKDAIRWISHHMDHPLFLCICNKSAGMLTLYSYSRLWLLLFECPNLKSITLKLNSHHPPHHFKLTGQEKSRTAVVHLGPPILRKRLTELEEDPDSVYPLIEPWIIEDAGNIARRRVGRIAARCVHTWRTNIPPGPERYENYYWAKTAGASEAAEENLIPMLTALGHHYRHYKLREKFDAVVGLLKAYRPLLKGEHAIRFADEIDGIDNQGP